MNQKPANRPLSNLLQTTDSPNRVDKVVDGLPELVFRSPTIKEVVGNTTFVILIIAFGFPVVLIGVLATMAGYKSLVLGLLVLPSIAIISFVLYSLLKMGHVVLKSDKLVEYNLLNYPRSISYAQIFEVKQGRYADQVWIRYYSTSRNGQTNYKSIRATNLIPVHRAAELRRELQQRINAPAPILSQSTRSIFIILLFGVLETV
jgi:hypothetical protein